jgi:hypothetical protein
MVVSPVEGKYPAYVGQEADPPRVDIACSVSDLGCRGEVTGVQGHEVGHSGDLVVCKVENQRMLWIRDPHNVVYKMGEGVGVG